MILTLICKTILPPLLHHHFPFQLFFQSTNPEFHNAVVRINIHDERSDKTHRQTIQYLHPSDAHKLGQAELVVIDEAAAIPLPLGMLF